MHYTVSCVGAVVVRNTCQHWTNCSEIQVKAYEKGHKMLMYSGGCGDCKWTEVFRKGGRLFGTILLGGSRCPFVQRHTRRTGGGRPMSTDEKTHDLENYNWVDSQVMWSPPR